MTVAMAAPLAPMARPEIRIGSRMMLTTAPPMVPIMDSLDRPSDRSRLEWIKEAMTTGEPMANQV